MEPLPAAVHGSSLFVLWCRHATSSSPPRFPTPSHARPTLPRPATSALGVSSEMYSTVLLSFNIPVFDQSARVGRECDLGMGGTCLNSKDGWKRACTNPVPLESGSFCHGPIRFVRVTLHDLLVMILLALALVAGVVGGVRFASSYGVSRRSLQLRGGLRPVSSLN